MTNNIKVADLTLERLAAGELPPEQARRINDGLHQNDEGNTRIKEIERSNQQILEQYPVAALSASIRHKYEQSRVNARRHRFRIVVPAVVAVAACSVLLVTSQSTLFSVEAPTGAENHSATPYVGIKGEPQIHIHKKTTEGEAPVGDGDMVNAGDVLQLKYNSGPARSVVIFSVDGRGEVTLHFPESVSTSTRVTPGKKEILPFAYELDDAPDFERFVIVWSEESADIDTRKIMDSAKRLASPAAQKLTLPKHLRQKDVVIKKGKGDLR